MDSDKEDVQALVAMGHSVAYAMQIVLDAKRGDVYARRWLGVARGVAMRLKARTDD